MQIFISLVVADVSDDGIRTTVSTSRDVIQQDLFEYYSDALSDGGLDDTAWPLEPDATLEDIVQAIEVNIGRPVVIQESDLISP
jgi:hypothetical protein